MGEEPGLAAVDRSGIRPRWAGPHMPEGDHAMEDTSTISHPAIASGEKAKARDILAAIRTLQDHRARPATSHYR